MKSFLIRLCLATALLFGSAGFALTAEAAPAAQAPKPWSQADSDELNGIVNAYLVPLINTVNKAVGMMQTDQAGACTLSKTAQDQANEADRRLKALTARITAEGKDTAPLAQVNAKMVELMKQMPELVKQICSGDLTNVSDPATKAMVDKLMGYVTRYTAAMAAAVNAQQAGDTPKTCASLRDALSALTDMEAYIKELQVQYAGQDPTGEIPALSAKVAKWKSETQAQLASCPAA